MIEIIPAIIPKDLEEIKEKLKLVEPYADWVQLDISDGKFTTMKTWDDPEEIKGLATRLNLEAHLMISEPERKIDQWIASGVKRILIHFESTKNLPAVLDKIKNAGIEAAIVLNLQTPTDVLEKIEISKYPNLKIVQLMSIAEIGYYGQPFDGNVLSKISFLKSKYPGLRIAVDGGINKETAKKAVRAGADILAVGSAIFSAESPEKSIFEIKETLNNF
ncbi:MAG: ribulose-phosphate 3-epimerase [Candidatus Portnoybacteria bacterium]|nr:ribulose-phosphate 3-epimerase [Candidatus Portnoybacteria bacterium]